MPWRPPVLGGCWWGRHKPIRERQVDGVIVWRCVECLKVTGESAYPASVEFLKRQQVAHLKNRIWRGLRLVRRSA